MVRDYVVWASASRHS